MLVRGLQRSADPGNSNQQFMVNASGHAGSEDYSSILSLNVQVTVESEPTPAANQPPTV